MLKMNNLFTVENLFFITEWHFLLSCIKKNNNTNCVIKLNSQEKRKIYGGVIQCHPKK